jgi:hypothetical protein
MGRNKTITMIKTHSISEMIQKNQERKNIHWMIADGEKMYRHNESGLWFHADTFNEVYPKYEYEPFNPKGENINKKIFKGL